MLHILSGVDIPPRHLVGSNGCERIVDEKLRLVEVAADLGLHHVRDLVVPFALLMIRFALEHERSLQVLDHDGVIGTGADFHLAFKFLV